MTKRLTYDTLYLDIDTAPATPAAGSRQFYPTADGWSAKDDAGAVEAADVVAYQAVVEASFFFWHFRLGDVTTNFAFQASTSQVFNGIIFTSAARQSTGDFYRLRPWLSAGTQQVRGLWRLFQPQGNERWRIDGGIRVVVVTDTAATQANTYLANNWSQETGGEIDIEVDLTGVGSPVAWYTVQHALWIREM